LYYNGRNKDYHVTKHTFFRVNENEDETLSTSQNAMEDDVTSFEEMEAYPQDALQPSFFTRQTSTYSQDQPLRPTTFKIVTYNIWNTNGKWKERLDVIKQQLELDNPDIIAFQEVRFTQKHSYGHSAPSKSMHQVEDLAHVLPNYQYVYQPAMTYYDVNSNGNHWSHTDEGCAIFSKFPIVASSLFRLSRNFSDQVDEHQRALLHASILTPAGIIDVFTTHLSLSMLARRRNAVEMFT